MTNRIVKVVLRGDISDLQAKMAVAAKSIADTADKATGAGKASQEYRQHLSALGTTAGAVGLVAAAGLGLAVAAAARFDSAMSKVEAATHESAGNMDRLRAAAIKAGADTVFSATEAADAITALAKAGVSTKDVLAGGLAGALSLASAGELDVASAAEIAATAMTQFGLSGKDIPHIADLLAAGAGKAQGEVSDFAAALKYVGPVAHQMGISIEETTGTIAELASQGILGEQAGTSLRGMLTSLTSPSALAAKTMKSLGIELYDAQGNFVGLRGVAGQLSDTMGTLSNAERDQALGRIFGNEQITAARILYAGGAEAVAKWTGAVNDQGYAAETAAIKMDNLKGDLEQLSGSFETALIGLGEGDQGPLRDLVQTLTKAVNAFNDLPGPIKSATTGLLGITAITGGALWFGSKVLRGIADTRTALQGLGVEATTTRTLLSGIGKGLQFAAILEGLNLLDQGMDSLFNTDLDTTNLSRSLDALAANRVTGEIKDKWGDDLKGFGKAAASATWSVQNLDDAISGTAGKILKHVPLAGGFLSADVGDDIDNIKKMDTALAGLVEAGQQDKAGAIFDQLSAAANDAGVSTEELTGLFKQYEVAVGNAEDSEIGASAAAKYLTGAMTMLIKPTGEASDAAKAASANQEALAKALAASREAAGKTAHEFFGLGASVDDNKVSLNQWIHDLEKQASALRDFTKNAQTAGKRGLREGLIKELEAAGPAGALRMKQLADGTDAEIKRANRAWREGQKAIRAYVDQVGGVPPSVATDLQLNGEQAAAAAIKRIRAQLDQIPRRLQTDYYVNQINSVNRPKAPSLDRPKVTPADGGTIPHAAAGWTVAGQRDPYGDKVLAYLAPGEEVITNRHGEADQFRADRAAGRIPAYAAGSMTQPVSVPVGGTGFDYGRMASTFAGNQLLAHRDTRDAMLWAMRTALRETQILRASPDAELLGLTA